MNGEIVGYGDDGKWTSLRLKYSKGMLGCRNGVRGSVPEFLTKTYNIVNDPNTDSIVSWSSSATSFIIWDHNEFSATIIPRYFKHNNLSSFVYQLNNYGFRKIGVAHDWEYANPNFQGGKEYLLQNIKRRGQIRKTQNNPSSSHQSINNNRLEIKKEVLRNEIIESKLEIERLRIKQSKMKLLIAAVESEMKTFESKSEKLAAHWARAFAEFSKTKMEKKEEDNNHHVNIEERAAAIVDGISVISGNNCEAASASENTSGSDYVYWKNIIQGSVNNGGAVTGVENNISMDFEGLIAKLADQEYAELNTVTL